MSELAIKGGTPVVNRPLGKPWPIYGDLERQYLSEVLESGIWWRGGWSDDQVEKSKVASFERAFAAYQDAAYGVAVTNGTQALECALKALGIKPGDEVIVPAATFVATATAVILVNAIPIIVDIDPVTHNMNPDLIEAKVTDRTKAIIVTHVWGLPAPMDKIVEIARRRSLFVIEDCAHALFSTYKGRYVGTFGDVGSFSFQMSKQMALGDGGMAVTNDEKVRDELALHAGAPTFHSVAHGLHWNYRITEVTAAIGLAQLQRAPEYVAGLQAVARLYDDAVAGCDWITLQRAGPEAVHTFHLWAATFWGDRKGISLDDFRQALQRHECDVSIGYTGMPAYRHRLIASRMGYGRGCPLDCPHYAGMGNQYPDGLCPVAEEVIPRILLVYTFADDEYHKRNAERLHQVIQSLS